MVNVSLGLGSELGLGPLTLVEIVEDRRALHRALS